MKESRKVCMIYCLHTINSKSGTKNQVIQSNQLLPSPYFARKGPCLALLSFQYIIINCLTISQKYKQLLETRRDMIFKKGCIQLKEMPAHMQCWLVQNTLDMDYLTGQKRKIISSLNNFFCWAIFYIYYISLWVQYMNRYLHLL